MATMSTAATSPDEYVAGLTGWQRRAVEALRAAVRETAALDETLKWGHLVYVGSGPVLLIRAEPARLLFGFWRGRQLRDIEPRLAPGGRYEMATLKIDAGTPLERDTVVELVRRAVALDQAHGNPQRPEPR